ncbi:thiamine phosphate synthase [Chryseobacterium sp. CT-SW4]|uniref:thiamine phosphate synthase n=1 Tax=Chryseobacterium sp. SW-1 TaxID=3157343 RepID=UPI003B01147D
MIIVITPEQYFKRESDGINKLLEEGLELLHIRKPYGTKEDLKVLLDGIEASFYPKLVLHNYHETGKQYGISRFHFTEQARVNKTYPPYEEGKVSSTSVHDIDSYNRLNKEWEYAFLSPVFPSISKPGHGRDSTLLDTIGKRNNKDVKLIALGGIDEKTIPVIKDKNIDGIALLGAIWQNEDPLSAFKKCRKIFKN